MKNNDNDENNKYTKETLAKSKTITKSVNIFMQKNKLGNPNINQSNNNNNKNMIMNNNNKKNIEKIDESDEDMEEENNNIDEDDEGIYTYEYVTSNIDTY